MPFDHLSIGEFASHLLLGGAFVFAGIRNVTSVPVLTSLLAARGVPFARWVLYAGIALQIVCGVLVIAGVWTFAAAAALIVFLVAATFLFPNFWDHTGLDRGNRINGVVSNTALVGAFLLVMATAP